MTPAARQRPDRRLEHCLLADSQLVGGVDEVGRGALAGVVTVGVAVVSRKTADAFPVGLADSKQLTPLRRQALVDPLRQWLTDHAVAHASPAEIDTYGIVAALRLAGGRALEVLAARGHAPQTVILDGVSDWLSAPREALLLPGPPGAPCGARAAGALAPQVRLQARADAGCAVVAAASVLAKVERDALMSRLEDPGYGWASNKGYASPAHVEALARLGASEHHRRSWRLPGLGAAGSGRRPGAGRQGGP